MSAGNGATPPLRLVNMGTVDPKPVNWLWRPYVPIGKLTLVMGDPEAGKSWLTLALAAAVSKGGKMWDTKMRRGRVLLLSAEDGLEDTISARLEMLGANPGNIIAVEEAFELEEAGIKRLRAAVDDVAPILVVIDPIIAYTGKKMDTYRANQVRDLMTRLKVVADECRVAICMVIHMRKQRQGAAMLGVQGSMDFIAAARSVVMVGRSEDQVDGERTLAHAKCSVAARGPSLSYQIAQGRFQWLGEVPTTADDLHAVADSDKDVAAARKDAKLLIKKMLEGGAWLPSADLMAEAKEQGISERTLKRARAALGVEVQQREDGWWCRLPRVMEMLG